MTAVCDIGGVLPYEAKVSLVNKGGALESMVRAFPTKVMPGNAPQLLIDEGNKGLESLLVAGPPFAQ